MQKLYLKTLLFLYSHPLLINNLVHGAQFKVTSRTSVIDKGFKRFRCCSGLDKMRGKKDDCVQCTIRRIMCTSLYATSRNTRN